MDMKLGELRVHLVKHETHGIAMVAIVNYLLYVHGIKEFFLLCISSPRHQFTAENAAPPSFMKCVLCAIRKLKMKFFLSF